MQPTNRSIAGFIGSSADGQSINCANMERLVVYRLLPKSRQLKLPAYKAGIASCPEAGRSSFSPLLVFMRRQGYEKQ